MAKIRIVGDSSGYVELAAPNAAGNNTLELPSNATKLVGADASNSLNVSGIATFSSGINVGTGASISSPATNVLVLGTNDSEVVRVFSNGYVGINSTAPGYHLDVRGGVRVAVAAGNTFIDIGGDGGRSIEIGAGGSTDTGPNCYLDFHGADATYPDFATRLIRSTGANGNFELVNRGTGSTNISAQDAGNVVLRTNANDRVIVDSSGRVTMPYQPVFYAYQSAGASASSTGIFNSTQWNTTLVNTGSHFSTSNGRFTAPIAGVYMFQIKGLARYSGATGAVEISLYKNGANVVTRAFGYSYMVAANDHATITAIAYLSLAVSDYVQMGVHAMSAGTDLYYGENLGSFCGELVG